MISPIAENTISFSIEKDLAPQLETPNPVKYMPNKTKYKIKPQFFKSSKPLIFQ